MTFGFSSLEVTGDLDQNQWRGVGKSEQIEERMEIEIASLYTALYMACPPKQTWYMNV